MGNKIGVLVAQGLNVPNFVKDVSNFVKDVSNFIKDVPNFVKNVPRVPMSVPRSGITSNHYLRVLKG